jgi:hypothetical protein
VTDRPVRKPDRSYIRGLRRANRAQVSDSLRCGELFQTAGLDGVDQSIKWGVEGVQGHIQLGAFRPLTC